MSSYNSENVQALDVNQHYSQSEFQQQYQQEYQLQRQNQAVSRVLCYNCGVSMDGSSGLTICSDCISLTVDITEGIPRQSSVTWCRDCERYLLPPQRWVRAALESRELLAICLKKLKGLNKLRLINANFIWTEPHSRRIKLKVTVQGEAMSNAIIEQSLDVEFLVNAMQCPDCAKSYTTNTWRANVQIRQKVPHKRTFLYIEQLILKHNAHLDTISIQESKDGLDFFYAQKNHAVKMLDFLSEIAPIKYQKSQELISQDSHTAVKLYKFSFSVEIVPICKDDLVVLPLKLARSLGNISRLVLCSKITNSIQFLDPFTLQTADLTANVYWRSPFSSLANVTELVEFVILDVELTGTTKGRYALADITCARSVDLGSNDQTYYIRSHMGGILHPGDEAMGYFTANSNYNSDLWDSLDTDNTPDIILVKKSYAGRSKKRSRNWKLKRMAIEHPDIEAGKETRQQKQEKDMNERDLEIFLQELQEDEELRQTVNLYKAPNTQVRNDDDMDDEDDDAPHISIDELLEDLDDLTMNDNDEAMSDV